MVFGAARPTRECLVSLPLWDLFLFDATANTVTLVTRTDAGQVPALGAQTLAIDRSGRFVSFMTEATDISTDHPVIADNVF